MAKRRDASKSCAGGSHQVVKAKGFRGLWCIRKSGQDSASLECYRSREVALQKCDEFYGFARAPAVKLSGYPKYKSSAQIIEEAARDAPVEHVPAPRVRRSGKKHLSCLRPADEMRGDMLQWVELVGNPRETWKSGPIQMSDQVYRYFRDAHLSPQENMYVLSLNNRGIPLGHVLVSKGTVGQALVDPADVFRPALLSGAARIIVAHNHPAGDPQPSPQDIALTKRLKEVGATLGVPLLDHVIVTKTGYVSLRDFGVLG